MHWVCPKCSLEKALFGPVRNLSKCASTAFFLAGDSILPVQFYGEIWKGFLEQFHSGVVQENLLFAFMDGHRVHLPVSHQQVQLLSVCVPVCPNSMWLC